MRLNISAYDGVKHSSDTWLPAGTANRSHIEFKSKAVAWVVHGC